MTVKNEDYLQYEFMCKQYRDLMTMQHSILSTLQSKPADIKLSSNLIKVRHDIHTLTPLIQKIGIEILESFEVKYGVKFQFLIPPVKEKEGKVLKI